MLSYFLVFPAQIKNKKNPHTCIEIRQVISLVLQGQAPHIYSNFHLIHYCENIIFKIIINMKQVSLIKLASAFRTKQGTLSTLCFISNVPKAVTLACACCIHFELSPIPTKLTWPFFLQLHPLFHHSTKYKHQHQQYWPTEK